MGVETVFVMAQAIPAHTLEAQIGGAVVFAVVLFGVVALFRRVSREASIERAEAVIEEHWAELEKEASEEA